VPVPEMLAPVAAELVLLLVLAEFVLVAC